MKNKVITKWEPDEFDLETALLRTFPERGSRATYTVVTEIHFCFSEVEKIASLLF